jgi:hypothetical protein
MNVISNLVSGPDDSGPTGVGREPSAAPAPIGRADLLVMGAIAVLWVSMAIVVDPVGDFPLNDDWAYGLPVKWLVETGRLRVTDWAAMTLVAHVVWGSLPAILAGFSFTALRISTLAIAPVGLSATYLAGREIGLPRWLAAAAVGLFVVSPIFISLSYSFMTDINFFSLMMLAVFLLLRGVRRGDGVSYWAGWAAVLAATLIRQLGLAIPIGLVIALALKDGFSRSWLVRVAVPAAAMFVVVAAYPKVAAATIGLSATYARTQDGLRLVFVDLMHLRLGALKPLLYGVGCGVMHLGWWMLPLLVLLPPPRGRGDGPGKGALAPLIAAGSAAALTAFLWATGRLMPLGSPGSILIDLGTGPRTLAGEAPHAPGLLWLAVTALAAFGAASIILALASFARRSLARLVATRDPRPLWLPAFLIIVGMVYCIPFSYYGPWFDRYMLPEMGLLGLLLAGEAAMSSGEGLRPSISRVAVAAALAAVYLGFGVASAHDYLAWNRSRWEAGRSLMEAGDIAPAEIDGGFEFNQYFAYRDNLDAPRGEGEGVPGARELEGEAQGRRRFVLAFSESPGRSVVRRFPVDRWMPLSPEQVVILGPSPP